MTTEEEVDEALRLIHEKMDRDEAAGFEVDDAGVIEHVRDAIRETTGYDRTEESKGGQGNSRKLFAEFRGTRPTLSLQFFGVANVLNTTYRQPQHEPVL